MWRWNAVVVALVLVHALPLTGTAQDCRESLIAQQAWTRFEVVLGRITAFHLRGGQNHCSTDPQSPDLPRESVSVNGDASAPAFRYERFDADSTLTVEIVNRSQVEIRQQEAEPAQLSLHFVQSPRGPLRLTIRDGEDERTYAARSIWHLLLAEPEVSRTRLMPILEGLRPDWRLMEKASKIEDELFRSTAGNPAISRREIVTAVSQLDSRQFSQRQAADRRLRSFGVAVLPFLSRLDRGTLSVEQRIRLRRIRDGLAVPTADTAERVAAWLSNDKSVWLALLSHEEPAKREAAAMRLTDIHPGTVQFDPFGDESLRRQQIAQLRLAVGD